MTPVAHAIAREMCKPLKQRRLRDPDNIGRLIADAHCFDVTEAEPIVHEVFCNGEALRSLADLMFLPSPITCIRTLQKEDDERESEYLLRQVGQEIELRLLIRNKRTKVLTVSQDAVVGAFATLRSPSVIGPGDTRTLTERSAEYLGLSSSELLWRVAASSCVVINSPRVIGRTTIAPHVGLQREIARSKGMPGKYPLHATTEIKLIVGVQEAGKPEPTHLSGDRALHFVRSHMRVVGGVLVQVSGVPVRLGGEQTLVKAHWRGNPALGIKRSRYKVEPA